MEVVRVRVRARVRVRVKVKGRVTITTTPGVRDFDGWRGVARGNVGEDRGR